MAKKKNKPLPEGWDIVGLYTLEGNKRRNVRAPADSEIVKADAIIVRYRDPSKQIEEFRVIHGARDKAQIGDLIRKVVIPESPIDKKRKRGKDEPVK